jgi:preprotein translocase SecE subunit
MNDFINKIRGELRHVIWPTREQTILYTTLVIIVSLAVAYYLGGLDWLFARGLESII